ncbi:unnamed protein product [Camellia sinensis]
MRPLFYGAWLWWWDTNNILFPFTRIVLTITWYVWIFTITSKNNQPPLPPGPRGLPVVGILPFLDPELYSCFESLSRTYGPIMRLLMGTKVGIVFSSPSAAQEMFRDHDITFANHDVPELASAAVAKVYCLRRREIRNTMAEEAIDQHWRVVDRARIFLQVLLQLKNEGDAKTPLTMTHLKVLFMDMVLGGTETTSNAIEFAMA